MTHALALLTFFLAFYTQTCYTRFIEQYDAIKAIEGHIRSIGIRVRNLFKAEEEIAQVDMMELFRFLCGSYFLLFVRLYDGEKHHFSLQTALDMGLVTIEEKHSLKRQSPGMRWMKMISWAFGYLYKVAERQELEDLDLGSAVGEILQVRQVMNQVTYKFQMPVPLAYYHVITVLTLTVTVFFSYAMGYSSNISPGLCWGIWVVVVFGFLGMREVAIQLAEPFGDDDCDLPVDNYVHNLMAFLIDFVSEDESEMESHTFSAYWAHRHVQDSEVRKKLSDMLNRGLFANGVNKTKKVEETDEGQSYHAEKDPSLVYAYKGWNRKVNALRTVLVTFGRVRYGFDVWRSRWAC